MFSALWSAPAGYVPTWFSLAGQVGEVSGAVWAFIGIFVGDGEGLALVYL